MTKQYLTLLFFLVVAMTFGQQKSSNDALLRSYESTSATRTFQAGEGITAIAIQCDCDGPFKVVFGKFEMLIPKDHDATKSTFFLSLPHQEGPVTLHAPANQEHTVYLINTGKAPQLEEIETRQTNSDDCIEELTAVLQSEWRAGLPRPVYTRSYHDVNHNIVHHSAGSNSKTDYVQVVRDIYTLHTQVNGWSDIGYNYLIAQDGTIFAGRDPGNGSQDRVRGAHFCGKNTGTLGVCVLGNYEETTPTVASVEALETVLSYQLIQQEHGSFDFFTHSGQDLGTIAGHRDGCATLCPGRNLYSQLGDIKRTVGEMTDGCEPFIDLTVSVSKKSVKVAEMITLEAEGSYEGFQWILDGSFYITPSTPEEPIVQVAYEIPGFYDVGLVGISRGIADTLIMENFIKVKRDENRPVVFPNPAYRSKHIQIDLFTDIDEVILFDSKGESLIQTKSKNISIQHLNPGLYFLQVRSTNRVYKEKLVVL